MIYAKIPAIDGVPDTEHTIVKSVSLSDSVAVAQIIADEAEQGWEEITKEEFETYLPKQETSTSLERQIEELKQQNDQLQQDNLLLMLALTEVYERLGGDE